MAENVALETRIVRWPVIAALSTALFALVIVVGAWWPRPRPLPLPAQVVEPPAPWAPTPALEVAIDAPVLHAVLAPACASTGADYSVLASQPDEPAGPRSNGGPSQLPAGLECGKIRLVSSARLEKVFSEPDPANTDSVHLGWGSFYQNYRGATGVIHLSLPAYSSPTSAVVKLGRTSCLKCGAGW